MRGCGFLQISFKYYSVTVSLLHSIHKSCVGRTGSKSIMLLITVDIYTVSQKACRNVDICLVLWAVSGLCILVLTSIDRVEQDSLCVCTASVFSPTCCRAPSAGARSWLHIAKLFPTNTFKTLNSKANINSHWAKKAKTKTTVPM